MLPSSLSARAIALLVLACVARLPVSGQTTTYDLKNDFSPFQNPSGAWSYEQGLAPISARVSFGSEASGWGYESSLGGSVLKWVVVNPGLGWQDLQIGDISVHGLSQPSAASAGVAWTSPEDGTISITGRAWGIHFFPDRNANWTLSVAGAVVAQRALAATVRRNDPSAQLDANVVAGRTLTAIPVRRGDRVVWLNQTTTRIGHFLGIDLRITHTVVQQPPALPTVATQPQGQTVNAGLGFTVSATVSNATSYQWLKNGDRIPGATAASFSVARAQPSDAGSYALLASNSTGTLSTNTVSIVVIPPRLANVSVRSMTGNGDQSLIVGFVINGSGQKQALIRGIGPTLAQFGVNGALADPTLRLRNAAGAILSENAVWGGSAALTQAFSNVGAFALSGTSRDSAIYSTLAAGAYTAQVAGTSPGIALLECYDSDPTGILLPTQLVNLSARNVVGTGDSILVAGFVIAGFSAKNLLIRGIGPSLEQFGVTGPLSNPILRLFRDTALVSENDDWGGGATLTNTFSQVGAFALPANSRDAALIVILQPGSYTAQLSGLAGTTGVRLIEIYDLP